MYDQLLICGVRGQVTGSLRDRFQVSDYAVFWGPCAGSHDIFSAVEPDVRHDKRQTAGRPMRLVVSLLLIGQGFKSSPRSSGCTRRCSNRVRIAARWELLHRTSHFAGSRSEATPTLVWSPVVRRRRSIAHLLGPDPRPTVITEIRGLAPDKWRAPKLEIPHGRVRC